MALVKLYKYAEKQGYKLYDDKEIVSWTEDAIEKLGYDKPKRNQSDALMEFLKKKGMTLKKGSSAIKLKKFLDTYKETLPKSKSEKSSDSDAKRISKSSSDKSKKPIINNDKYSRGKSMEYVETTEYTTRDLMHVFGSSSLLLIETESEHAWAMTFNKNVYIIQDDIGKGPSPKLYKREWILSTNKPKDTESLVLLKKYIKEKLKSLPDDSDSSDSDSDSDSDSESDSSDEER